MIRKIDITKLPKDASVQDSKTLDRLTIHFIRKVGREIKKNQFITSIMILIMFKEAITLLLNFLSEKQRSDFYEYIMDIEPLLVKNFEMYYDIIKETDDNTPPMFFNVEGDISE